MYRNLHFIHIRKSNGPKKLYTNFKKSNLYFVIALLLKCITWPLPGQWLSVNAALSSVSMVSISIPTKLKALNLTSKSTKRTNDRKPVCRSRSALSSLKAATRLTATLTTDTEKLEYTLKDWDSPNNDADLTSDRLDVWLITQNYCPV